MYQTNSAHRLPYARPCPHQRLEQQALGSQNNHSLLANFREHLSDGYDYEESIGTSDDGEELVITGSRPVPKPLVLTDANKPAIPGPLALEPGCDVQLDDESFVRIVDYLPRGVFGPTIIGHRLLRQNHYELLMPERDHELVQLIKADDNLNPSCSLSTVRVCSIVRNCKIIFTNQQYRHLNYAKDVREDSEDVSGKHIYFCRYMSTDNHVGTDEGDPDGPPLACRIEHLRFRQADSGALITNDRQEIPFRIPDAEVRKQWRGEASCKLGGSHVVNHFGMHKAKYTFGDAFAGAGGTSCGADSAGLKMKFAFDLDFWATETYKANFEHTGMQILHTDVHDFVRMAALSPNEWLVDILHLSPPCQPFCGANRKPNAEEDRCNLAAFARVTNLLEICKPRIATLEEAKSLTDIDKRGFFRKVICFFIKKGYSVQWKVLHLDAYGVPQTRKRTVFIASSPGEILPSFVRPTHGSGFGLKEPPSIATAINNIPADALHHDEISKMRTAQPPLDESGLCATLLTRPKPKHYHPSGERKYSTREGASLQTFPLDFIFCGPTAAVRWKQIGNAVPPAFARELFRHLKTELRANDQAELRGDLI